MADNLILPSLEILGASTSWSPKGLSRPVMGQLYSTLLQILIYINYLPSVKLSRPVYETNFFSRFQHTAQQHECSVVVLFLI